MYAVGLSSKLAKKCGNMTFVSPNECNSIVILAFQGLVLFIGK